MSSTIESTARSSVGTVIRLTEYVHRLMTPIGGDGGLANVTGSARVTKGGTVNCRALMRSVQEKLPPSVTFPLTLVDVPTIVTKESGSPPLHLIVTPLVRSIPVPN